MVFETDRKSGLHSTIRVAAQQDCIGEGFLILEKEKTDVGVLEPSVVVTYWISPHILRGDVPTTRGQRFLASVFFFVSFSIVV